MAEIKEYLAYNYDKFNIDGSTSMLPLHQSLNDLFSANKKEITQSKTVEAFEKFINDENDILLGVDYSDELLSQAKNSGVELVKKEITREAFVFLINKNNPVRNLTIDQIKDIYSGKIANWSEVGGDNAPIKAYQRNSDSGSQIRMHKFMGNTKLTENDVEYVMGMGDIIEQISKYDEGKYSIAYNMYTFTEKQYTNDEVILLNVNGVQPNDDSIFNETYPINIYNYIYCDKNNALATEFADNLYTYLMSDEGQKLISNSGYVNLNEKYNRNKDINVPFDIIYENSDEVYIYFYNKTKGEFYDVDGNGNLLVFNNFADYVLRDTQYQNNTQYRNNAKAREYLTLIFNSDIEKNPYTAFIDSRTGIIRLTPWFDASMDQEDFFNFKYDNKYYSTLEYYIDEDKYILTAESKEDFDSYFIDVEESSYLYGYLDSFSNYVNNYVPGSTLELTKEDLKNLYLRTFDYRETQQLKFFQPFK
jgi:ABC-type phosphate transport system substrate-binding protein